MSQDCCSLIIEKLIQYGGFIYSILFYFIECLKPLFSLLAKLGRVLFIPETVPEAVPESEAVVIEDTVTREDENVFDIMDDEEFYDADVVIPTERVNIKKKLSSSDQMNPRQSWNEYEHAELTKLFAMFFEQGLCPRQADCEAAMKISKKNGGRINFREQALIYREQDANTENKP